MRHGIALLPCIFEVSVHVLDFIFLQDWQELPLLSFRRIKMDFLACLYVPSLMALQTYSPTFFSAACPRDKSPFVEMTEPHSTFVQEIVHGGLQSALHLMLGVVSPTSIW